MHIHFLRHATFILKLKDVQFLVDPMLSPAEAMDPVGNAASRRRIPMVELPLSDDELNQALGQISGVLVSHIHRDHWDDEAKKRLPMDVPIFCQPPDEEPISKAGFKNITSIHNDFPWRGITIHRTGGRHGTGELGARLGPVSGFVVKAESGLCLYIAGDTIWCPEVKDALKTHAPDVIVVNAGATSFLTGGPITMTAEDVASVCRASPSLRVVAVHMETVNHCIQTRDELRQFLAKEKLLEQVLIPADGEMLEF